MSKLGFYRIIFDKTAIENIGYNFFHYGSLESYDNNQSALSVDLNPFFIENAIVGLKSFRIISKYKFHFDTSQSNGIISISTNYAY